MRRHETRGSRSEKEIRPVVTMDKVSTSQVCWHGEERSSTKRHKNAPAKGDRRLVVLQGVTWPEDCLPPDQVQLLVRPKFEGSGSSTWNMILFHPHVSARLSCQWYSRQEASDVMSDAVASGREMPCGSCRNGPRPVDSTIADVPSSRAQTRQTCVPWNWSRHCTSAATSLPTGNCPMHDEPCLWTWASAFQSRSLFRD